ncbi:hypothetical protein [Nocardia arizonensis]|uniref:hypothetical protein n=1 Tax=Nocardia arizonensis TaxID=1141647 RepID=UPI0006D03A55|nr:hypothetical protein [Nocardia arizonensis]
MSSYPNVHEVLITLLTPIVTTVKSRRPGLRPPYTVVRRVGGAEDGITDRPIVRVDTYADTDEQAEQLKQACRQAITESGGTLAGDVLIDTAREITGGQESTAADLHDIRQSAIYQLSFRASR